jgi:uncharacterized protein (TIGR02246 family)
MMEFKSLFETYKNAVFQKDVEAFASIFDESVQVFDMWGQWTYDGLVAWREMAKGWFSSLGTDRDVVIFDNIQIQETDELATATAFVRFTAVSEKGEELRYLENRLTWIARKKNEKWVIIHQHTSGPVDFETMKVILRRSNYNISS